MPTYRSSAVEALSASRRFDVSPPILRRGEAEPGGPDPVEEPRLAAELPVPAPVLAGVVRVVPRHAVEAEIGLPPAQQPFDPRVLHRRPAEARGGEDAAEAVALADVRQARRDRVEALGGEGLPREQVIEGAHRAGGAEPGAERPLRPAGELAIGREGAVGRRAARHQVDHAAERRRAVERGGRAAQHLDPLHVEEELVAEVEGGVGLGRVVERHPVQQHEHVPAVGAAQEGAGLLPRPAELGDPQAGHGGQRLRERLVAALLDVAAGQHGDGGRHPLGRGRDAGAGDDGVGEGGLLCGGIAAGGGQGGEAAEKGGRRQVDRASHRDRLRARVTTRPAPVVRARDRRASSSHPAPRPPGGSGRADEPVRRCTPPGTRETSLRRPVSWLADRTPGPAFSRRPAPGHGRRNGAWGRALRLQLRGQPRTSRCSGHRPARRLRAFPFQPLRATGAWGACSRLRTSSPGRTRCPSRSATGRRWRRRNRRRSAPCRGR